MNCPYPGEATNGETVLHGNDGAATQRREGDYSPCASSIK